MRHTTLMTVAVTSAVAGSLLLAGCGSDGPNPFDAKTSAAGRQVSDAEAAAAIKAAKAFSALPAKTIDTIATKATKRLTAMRFVADVVDAGQRTKLDLTLDDRNRCSGSVSTAEGSLKVIKLHDDYWIKPGNDFLENKIVPEQGQTAANLLRGKWLVAPLATSPCDFDKLLGELTSSAPASVPVTVTKQGRSKVLGQDTIEITETTGQVSAHVFVRTLAPHYAVRVVLTGNDNGTIELSRYDQPVAAHAPPKKLIVDTTGTGS